jgi:hypothetical protein
LISSVFEDVAGMFLLLRVHYDRHQFGQEEARLTLSEDRVYQSAADETA